MRRMMWWLGVLILAAVVVVSGCSHGRGCGGSSNSGMHCAGGHGSGAGMKDADQTTTEPAAGHETHDHGSH